MTSSRLVFGLLTVMLVLALVPSTFAQVNITLISNGSPGEIQTNRNAQIADPSGGVGAGILVSGALLTPSALTTTNLVLTFPALITSAGVIGAGGVNIPVADPIRIDGQTGVFIGAILTGLNTTTNAVSIQLPSSNGQPLGTNTQSGSFRLVGVRLDVNGKTAPLNATVTLSSSANSYILQTVTVPAIVALGPGIGGFAIGARSGNTDQGAATVFTNRNIVDPVGNIIITEGFATAWRTAQQLSNNTGAVPNSTTMRLTFNSVPTGVTLTLTNQGASGVGTAFTLGNPTITSTSNATSIVFTGASLTATDTIQIGYTVSLSSTAAPAAGSITATATMVPIGDAYPDPTGTGIFTASETGGYPRFVQADNGPITVVNIVPANTTMLIPYALVLPPYDTGLAIANTTADPFTLAGGGATPTAGGLIVTFFPTLTTGGAASSYSVTTSSTVKPGAGLSSDGTLAPGATWTGLLSQLMTAAGQTGQFVGYVFVQAGFLNAHGTATISDFRTYSLTAHVLILPPPATSSRNAPSAVNGEAAGAEALGY